MPGGMPPAPMAGPFPVAGASQRTGPSSRPFSGYSEKKTAVVGVTESWLDKSTEEFPLEGYTLVGRKDRDDGRQDSGEDGRHRRP